ncbi:hypothetical protein SAMD00019534_054950 [Acytostelium subglobosum LB1]|uniref:hypothetical protein n=1 Tax=Acytostelium subglobosum LB1 TaxID=1410327 RepID=UPI000644E948|nr:hypothetical protein SAMD00019534_054950 [Acytostelium subglobosum LB1]GAM22320.1 hypothetical protein SAMD00019534_054950 [Acytostelium subglobosum LB1]|eukprot:XP_012754440.1 hypothetical protein SAMD00019534_054950 [Acytostelium subglobosum LB1]
MASSREVKRYSILLAVCGFIFLIFASIGLGVTFANLVPSIQKANGYSRAQCNVTAVQTVADCYSSQCATYNNEIWWYPVWGPGFFFIYVGGSGSSNSYNNGDDDGGDDDDGGMDGESGDSGGGDDFDGDAGGEDGGFDIGGDDFKGASANTPGTTTGGDLIVYTQEIKQFKQQQRQQAALAAREYLATLATDFEAVESTSSEASWTSSEAAACGYNYCAQGVDYVSFTDGDNVQHNSTIRGLWSSDEGWVAAYMANFVKGSSYNCYYQRAQPQNVMWFPPPPYDKGSLIMICFFFGLALISLIGTLIYTIKYFKAKHDSKHESCHVDNEHKKPSAIVDNKYNNYQIVYQQLPETYQVQEGGYYQYSYGIPYNPTSNDGPAPSAPSASNININ